MLFVKELQQISHRLKHAERTNFHWSGSALNKSRNLTLGIYREHGVSQQEWQYEKDGIQASGQDTKFDR